MPFEKKDKVKCTCKNEDCGKTFYVFPCDAHKAKYCSRECYGAVIGKKMKLLKSTEEHRVVIYCLNESCKSPIVLLKGRAKKRKYCCYECFLEDKARRDPLINQQYIEKEQIEEKKEATLNIWRLNY